MQKDLVIFVDQEKDHKENNERREPNVILPHKEYLRAIEEVYNKGAEDIAGLHIEKLHAKKEAQINSEREKAEVKERFQNINKRQDIELLRLQTVFPFDFFPDTIVIDTTKLTISHKQFFATEFVTTIPLKDISDVTIQTAFFMASLITKYIPQANSPVMNQAVEIKVSYLWRKDAIRVKNILKGVMVAKAENIDISKLSPKEVVTVIEEFGYSAGVV